MLVKNKGNLSVLLIGLFFTIFQQVAANEHNEFSIPLNKEVDAPVYQFKTDNKNLIIWLPSEYGLNIKALKPIANKLQTLGIETWLVDLKSAYFAPRGKKALLKYKAKDTIQLIKYAKQKGKSNIYLISASGGAIPSLKLARHWQKLNPGQTIVKGIILLSPSLYASKPLLGQDADYESIAYSSNLATYIIQAENSSLALHSQKLVETLSQGGSQVYFHFLPGINDGFYARPIQHLSKADLNAKKMLAVWIKNAVKYLGFYPVPETASKNIKTKQKPKSSEAGLLEIKRHNIQLDIQGFNLAGKPFIFGKNRQLTLVSFWASWCPPCVKELPSLNRLAKKYKAHNLKVIAVNMGESKNTIQQFMRNHPIDAEIILDQDNQISKAWKVYVVPSNYLIDQNGVLRYGSVGAINWDDLKTQKIIQGLIRQASEKTR